MQKNCTTVYFSIRKTKVDKQGKCPIQISIASNGNRIYFNTGKKVKPSDWNASKQLVRSNSEEATLLNQYLNELRNKIFRKEVELSKLGYLVTPMLLKEATLDKVEVLNDKTLLQVFKEYQAMRKPLVGKKIVQDTFDNNELTGRYIMEFIKDRYNREDLYLHEVKIGFFQNFHSFLLTEKSICQNTSNKHLKFLKQLMNVAVSNGYIQHNALNSYKIEREPVEIDFLDDAELRRFINFETPIRRFERTRDAFLFGCFTGLAYIDIKTLRKEHFETDDEGRIWIKKKRVKTGILSRIPLLPMAKLLLEKYQDWPSEAVMPIQDPTDINENLKDIATLCGITKHVTFHTSRHTFATTVTLSNNISLEVVSKMMGHTNTRMTSHYAKIVDKCIADQMDKLMSSFEVKTED